uniref:Meiosis-specific nuclear structural protein 1 n=1 Tax=Lygus hesperus TaxID=30085 RepID=A0A0A9Y8X4_LYGHE
MDVQKQMKKLEKRNLMEAMKTDMEHKSKNVNLMRRLHQERQEAALEEKLARAQEAQGWRANELSQEEELAYHMDLAKREDICKLKERQQLWEMRELVDLKTQIRNAYFTKALHTQLAESRALKAKDRSELEEYKMRLQKEVEEHERLEHIREKDNEMRKRQYRNDLQDQIISGHKKKIEEQKQRLLDMQLVDDTIRTIIYEEKMQEEEVKRKRDLAKADHDAYMEAKQIWIQREREKEEVEERKIREYLCQKFEHEKQLQETNRKKADERIAAQEKLLDRIQQLKAGRDERERIAQILCDEETRLREEAEAKKKKESMLQRAQEMKETVENLLKEKMARAEEEKKMNEIYRQKLEREIEAAKKEEREKVEKERDKKKQYGAELRAGMEQLYRNRADEKYQQAAEQDARAREQKRLQDKIAEERRRIINEHGPQLYGYLPKNMVTQEDMSHLNPELRDYFATVAK